MAISKVVTIKIEGYITTSPKGIYKLMQFYNEAAQHSNKVITIDFYDLKWFEANLSALFEALLFRLQIENNLALKTDLNFLFSKFHVLFRNGCLRHENYSIDDLEQTTIPSKQFAPNSVQEFSDYIQMQLMGNRGMNYIEKKIKNQIHSDLYEVFQNISKHARTELPCFVCGQYYPTKGQFMLTIVDLGIGFLTPILEYTQGEIKKDFEAIKWAVSGGSTKITNPSTEIGGLGLSGIYEYCQNNNGVFQIYSGKDFWGSDLERSLPNGYLRLKYYFNGSVLNIIFDVQDKN